MPISTEKANYYVPKDNNAKQFNHDLNDRLDQMKIRNQEYLRSYKTTDDENQGYPQSNLSS